MIFQTERLSFREWTEDDVDLALTLWGDPSVMMYIDARGGLSRTLVIEKLALELGYQRDHGTAYWPMFVRDEVADGDHQFVGVCGLKPWVHSNRGGFEIGFHVLPSAWGRGYAPEAARGVIAEARRRGIPHLMAGHHPDNAKARAILLGLGFEFLEEVLFKPTGRMHPSYRLDLSAATGFP